MMKRVFLVCLVMMLSVTGCAFASEIIVEDIEKGIWRYEADDIRILITRKVDESVPLIWYEAELFCSPESPLVAVNKNPGNKSSSFHDPEVLARSNKLVFAVNDDYYGDRVYNKRTPGIVIRGGKILQYKTFKSGNGYFPNLDTMALFPDGSLSVYQSKEKTANEYIDMGATDVFAFGPILLRDGVVNARLYKENTETEPRVGFGMVEPYHYLCVVTEGRHDLSRGTSCAWLAEKLKELGAVQALNLDGGQTASLVFMGKKINMTGIFNNRSRIRNISSMIGAGISDTVPE